MKIFSYVWKYKLGAIVITLLLLVQAAISFMLPTCTAKIIDVGIQQKGIEYAVPLRISEENYMKTIPMTSNNQLIIDSYNKQSSENFYELNDFGKKNIEALHQVMFEPIAYISNNENVSYDGFQKYCSNNNKNMIKQKAIAATTEEMQANGVDLASVQLDYLISNGAFMILLSFLFVIFSFCGSTLISIISSRIAMAKRSELFEAVMNFTSDDLNHFSESSLITRCTNDIQNIQNMTQLILGIVLYAPVTIIVGSYFAVTTALQLSWIIVAAAIAILLAAVVFRFFIIKYFRLTQKAIDRVNLRTREMLSGVLVSRAFNNAKHDQERFDEASRDLYKYQLITGRVVAVIPPALGLGMNFMSILIVLLGSFFISIGDIQVGSIVAFTTYSAIVVSAFTALGRFIGKLPQATVVCNRVEEVINYKSHGDVNSDAAKNVKHKDFDGVIKLENVSYSYDNSQTFAIKGVDFSIEAGKTVGIVGTVGSGKTTILNLLLRLHSASKGKITLNGQNVGDVSLLDYRALFAYAPQQSFLFSGSVQSNVNYGIRDEALANNEDYLKKNIEIAQASDFVYNEANPEGLERAISQGSTNISGGQRQRLSIARALASGNPIIVFDDCYSALDYGVERQLRDSIASKFPGRTKVIVSSRISSIMDADQIICMHEGKMAGKGTHEQLMKNCEEYIKIARSQLDKLPADEGGDL